MSSIDPFDPDDEKIKVSCPLCGASFGCRPGPDCWCTQMPALPMPDAATVCLCPQCLAARQADGFV